MAKRRFRARRRRVAPVPIGTIIAVFALGASPALADTGRVYFDTNDNAAAGDPSMLFNATLTGLGNVGLGRSVMTNLTTGGGNTAIGETALASNTSGDANVATGIDALFSNTTGTDNIATGASALHENTSGIRNVVTGTSALYFNTTGTDNVATGDAALLSNTTGNNNVATGNQALFSNETGTRNVAAGAHALAANTTGKANIALGHKAGENLTTGSDNIDIANGGKAGEAGTIRIGNNKTQTAAFIAGISDTMLGHGSQPVVIKSNGQLGVRPVLSSGAKPLSAAAGERLLARVKRQQQQIDRLRKEVRRGG